MKTLHESKFDTESGSRAYTAVCAGLTPTGEPFRRVVVEVNAEMSPGEVRKLMTNLQHDLSLAEQPADAEAGGYPFQVSVYCDSCEHTHSGDYLVRVTDDQATRFGYARAHLNREGWSCDENGDYCPKCAPAVSEDQPKPRVWRKGDVIPADVTKVYGDDWIYERSGEDAWQSGLAIKCGYTGHPMLARSTESLLAQYGSLSEVLPDPEAVTG